LRCDELIIYEASSISAARAINCQPARMLLPSYVLVTATSAAFKTWLHVGNELNTTTKEPTWDYRNRVTGLRVKSRFLKLSRKRWKKISRRNLSELRSVS